MAGERVGELLGKFRERYQAGDKAMRSGVLDELCRLAGYHRKYAISLLGRREEKTRTKTVRRRGVTYSAQTLRVVEAVWEAAGYPWSERLAAMLPQWLPWARKHVAGVTDEVIAQARRISARQIDRRLRTRKVKMKRRIYGRTKPGALLKHQIPVKTDHWDVGGPGYTEIDLVSHSGPNASGEFIHSLNVTDIHTGWCETRALMGKGEAGVVAALEEVRRALPFRLLAIDSDNGSEFINHHLVRYCKKHRIQFTRGRPYKKDDNAHIEQKNWTHVRRIFGWDRYDTREQQDAMNTLYRGDLRTMMDLFQPCVKLESKTRVGPKLQRHYDAARTPLNRLMQTKNGAINTIALNTLRAQHESTDPFALSHAIERQLTTLEQLRKKTKKRAA